jgi:hypothetical protein
VGGKTGTNGGCGVEIMKHFLEKIIASALLLLAIGLVILPFFEYERRRRNGGRYWLRSYWVAFCVFVGFPVLVFIYYVLGGFWFLFPELTDAASEGIIIERDMQMSITICILLPVALYLLTRKFIK